MDRFDVPRLVHKMFNVVTRPQHLETMHAWNRVKHGDDIVCIKPDQIKFSQSSVNDAANLTQKMLQHGWNGRPIDVVRSSDGMLITVDNTRVLAASRAGISAKVRIHESHERLTRCLQERFSTKRDGVPNTWGEAIQFRLNKQNTTYKRFNVEGSNFVGSME